MNEHRRIPKLNCKNEAGGSTGEIANNQAPCSPQAKYF